MSSTKTDSDPRLPVPALLRGPGSISGRLLCFFVGATAVLLLLAAIYLYMGLGESLARADRALVTGKLQVLRRLLRDEHDKPEVLASEVEHEAAANQLLRYYMRVLDERGRVLVETSKMAGCLPVTVFPPPAPFTESAPQVFERKIGYGQNYLLLAGEAVTGRGGDEKRLLQIALDVEHTNLILAEYRWKLVAMFGSGVVFAAVAGVMITRAGLRPLREITHTTQRITASKLGERLTAANWPAELRELAEEFDAMLDRLQDSFNRLTEFSADLAHALRNPINNLRGEAEVALTRARTPDEYRQTLASSLEEFERLSRLIENLLFIARADNPHGALERVTFPVRQEMDAVRDFYEALAVERGVAVTCSGDASLTGDPVLVRRAISNLLGNALKHTPSGGRVTLTAQPLDDGGVEVRAADTGCGIEPQHLPKVFDRFFQVDKTRRTNGNGAGLGLAIVHSIMHLHGGSTSIESTVGQGTTVSLRFPPPDARE